MLSDGIFFVEIFVLLVDEGLEDLQVVLLSDQMAESRQLLPDNFEVDSEVTGEFLGGVERTALREHLTLGSMSFEVVHEVHFDMVGVASILEFEELPKSFFELRILIIVVSFAEIDDCTDLR